LAGNGPEMLGVVDEDVGVASQRQGCLVIGTDALWPWPELRRAVIGKVRHGVSAVRDAEAEGPPSPVRDVKGKNREALDDARSRPKAAEVPSSPQLGRREGKAWRGEHPAQCRLE
jgi:hypothetical protein